MTENAAMNMNEMIRKKTISELLCLADSKWALGHWYIKVMLNSRTLTDATAFAGMSQDELGHTRALFRWMEDEFDIEEGFLEFGRDSDRIHNMELLDRAPESRGDFVLSAFLAETALWRLFATFKDGGLAPLANLVTHCGKETYFHKLSVDGWLGTLDATELEEMKAALTDRLPLALAWFGDDGEDALADAGVRSSSMAEAKAHFVEEVLNKLVPVLGLEDAELEALLATAPAGDFDPVRRRTRDSRMPATLWEFMVPTSDVAKLARRPLEVSIEDNIDLW
jgi:1,2-phenylacetyl-CoA epoxidase catalytic subunit